MSEERTGIAPISKPWRVELLWAKPRDFGARRTRSFETEQARDAAIAGAQRDGWQILRTWRAE